MELKKDIHKEFSEQYYNNLETQVIPVVKNFEKERKLRFVLASFIALIIAVLAVIAITILIFIAIKSPSELREYAIFKPFCKFGAKQLVVLTVFAAVYFWKRIQTDFEYKIKNQIMPALIGAFEGFEWIDEANDEYYQDMLDSDLFPYFNKKITHAYPDYFTGSYRDVVLEFSQAVYSAKKYVFNGGVIRIKMNKSFTGETILRPKGVYCKDLINMGLEKVTLEDEEFNKKFEIYSTDQIEARYLLTPAFMERLKNIAIQYTKNNKVYCSFKNDYIYIAPESKNGMFSLFGLTKRADNTENFNILFSQISSVLDLVDHFKLNERTGL